MSSSRLALSSPASARRGGENAARSRPGSRGFLAERESRIREWPGLLRNPKSEVRNPKQIRNSKSEVRNLPAACVSLPGPDVEVRGFDGGVSARGSQPFFLTRRGHGRGHRLETCATATPIGAGATSHRPTWADRRQGGSGPALAGGSVARGRAKSRIIFVFVWYY